MANKWGSLLIGQISKRGVVRPDTVRVRCPQPEFDERLNKHFRFHKNFWALENGIKTDIGDIVLLERLPQRATVLVTHSIKEQVFKLGAAIDPVSGKPCRGRFFIDPVERQLEAEQIAQERKEAEAAKGKS